MNDYSSWIKYQTGKERFIFLFHSLDCLTAFKWIFWLSLYPCIEEEEGILVYICPSFCPSVTNSFCHVILSSRNSHPLETWYDASRRGPIGHLPNSGLSIIYFRFPDLVKFRTLHYTVHIFLHIFHINHNSNPLETLYGVSSRSPTCRLPSLTKFKVKSANNILSFNLFYWCKV